MSPKRVAAATIAVLSCACTQHQSPAAPGAQVAAEASPVALIAAEAPPELASNDGRVPAFEVFAPGGVRYSSKALVGKEPFVAVFFATWCDYCQSELSTMQRAFREIGPIPIIPVSVDGPETWANVPGYLASFGIHAPAVRATHYRHFAATYNPADILPSVAIVGRDGTLVDYLHGYDPAHEGRLVASLRHAKK